MYDGNYKPSDVYKKAKNQKYDVVFTSLVANKSALLYNSLRELEYSPIIIGSDNIGGRKSFFDVLGKSDPKLKFYFTKQWDQVDRGMYLKEYNMIFKKYCAGYEKTMMTASSFDITKMLLVTLDKYPLARNEKLIELIKLNRFDGIRYKVKFNKSNTPDTPIFLFEIKGTKSVPVKML
ncbi:MAG: ABC-type branched-subunit amino acid transport system substrate-binding protein [Thermoproteota archaeon]|jgi:ABC-type branched-subunit amino acid transport system substrate-binding protein